MFLAIGEVYWWGEEEDKSLVEEQQYNRLCPPMREKSKAKQGNNCRTFYCPKNNK